MTALPLRWSEIAVLCAQLISMEVCLDVKRSGPWCIVSVPAHPAAALCLHALVLVS